jgi:hypothetical protein
VCLASRYSHFILSEGATGRPMDSAGRSQVDWTLWKGQESLPSLGIELRYRGCQTNSLVAKLTDISRLISRCIQKITCTLETISHFWKAECICGLRSAFVVVNRDSSYTVSDVQWHTLSSDVYLECVVPCIRSLLQRYVIL